MVNTGFLEELVQETNNEYAGLASEEEKFASMGFVDTGSYALNALVSGSIYGGILDNKIIGYAGEEATGKTFFALSSVKRFLDEYPDGIVAYFESEHALDKEEMESRGIDSNRVAIFPVTTIEDFRTQASKMLDKYAQEKEKDRPRMLFVLDSLGNTSTKKEVEDIEQGNEKRDMTKQQLIRGAFRVLSLKLGKNTVPMIVTNHIYQQQGMVFGDPREMCLAGDTLIKTEQGDRPIEEIEENEKVLTLNGYSPVSEKYIYRNSETFEIEMEDGTIIHATENHKFLVDGEWITTKTLMDRVQNTENVSISNYYDEGRLDVYREQVHENLLEPHE